MYTFLKAEKRLNFAHHRMASSTQALFAGDASDPQRFTFTRRIKSSILRAPELSPSTDPVIAFYRLFKRQFPTYSWCL